MHNSQVDKSFRHNRNTDDPHTFFTKRYVLLFATKESAREHNFWLRHMIVNAMMGSMNARSYNVPSYIRTDKRIYLSCRVWCDVVRAKTKTGSGVIKLAFSSSFLSFNDSSAGLRLSDEDGTIMQCWTFITYIDRSSIIVLDTQQRTMWRCWCCAVVLMMMAFKLVVCWAYIFVCSTVCSRYDVLVYVNKFHDMWCICLR